MTTEHAPDIELHDVTVRYGETTAVDGLSARLAGGRIHGLLGRNGSGKTSLLSVVAAFRRPTSGRVTIGGQPVYENPAVTRDVCFVRGAGDTVEHDWPSDKVKDALAFAAALRPRWDGAFADDLLERFEVRPAARLSELSRGQRSAVGIVLGLATRAPVTIFDESYLGLDAPSRYAFYDALLADYVAHPRTIVLSTHLIEEVARAFEEVLIIDQGRLLLHEDADTLRGRGVTVTGPATDVDRFVTGRTVLGHRALGGTKEATLFGDLDAADRRDARAAGLELGPVAMQDLFVHLTGTTPDTPDTSEVQP